MATLEALRRRVEGAEDLKSIVGAMKSISAVRIRQFRTAVAALEDYDRTLELGFGICFHHRAPEPVLEPSVGSPEVAIVLGADQGLAGQFNNRILEFTRERLGGLGREGLVFFTVGARVADRLTGHGIDPARRFPAPGTVEGVGGVVQDLLVACEIWRQEHGARRFTLFYNAHLGGARYAPRRQGLLPLDPDHVRKLRATPWEGPSLPTFYTSWASLFTTLLREHLFVSLFRACAESVASENASRLSAMEAAESRIDERLAELRRAFDHQRHETITEELLDIVSGFEALRGGRASSTS